MCYKQIPVDNISNLALIIFPDESRGYIGFTCIAPPPPYILICVRYNYKNAFTDFIQTWDTQVFGSVEEPYYKVTLNSQ